MTLTSISTTPPHPAPSVSTTNFCLHSHNICLTFPQKKGIIINNTKIKLDERINERDFGVDYLNQLPDDFTKESFDDKNFKVFNGESLNEMDKRFNDFIEELLKSDKDKSIIVIHGIMLLSFLQNNCDFKYDKTTITVKYNNKTIVENKPKSPGVYKITYVDKKIIDIDVIN